MEKKKKETEDLKKEANAAALSTADHHDSRLDAPSLSYACALVYVSFPTTFLLIRDFLIARFFVFFREPRRGQTHPIPTPFPFVHLVTCEKRGDRRGAGEKRGEEKGKNCRNDASGSFVSKFALQTRRHGANRFFSLFAVFFSVLIAGGVRFFCPESGIPNGDTGSRRRKIKARHARIFKKKKSKRTMVSNPGVPESTGRKCEYGGYRGE